MRAVIDTPRTDEEEDACRECGLHFVPEEFARKLERELHAMTLRCQAADRTANAALAARPEAQAQLPEEPTDAMLDAGIKALEGMFGHPDVTLYELRAAYKVMRLAMNSRPINQEKP
jgi:hypothetical protein